MKLLRVLSFVLMFFCLISAIDFLGYSLIPRSINIIIVFLLALTLSVVGTLYNKKEATK